MTVFSPHDIPGLRRPNNVKFGTKVASSTRMMQALRFLEKVFAGKFAKKPPKRGKTQKLATSSPLDTAKTMRKLAQT